MAELRNRLVLALLEALAEEDPPLIIGIGDRELKVSWDPTIARVVSDSSISSRHLAPARSRRGWRRARRLSNDAVSSVPPTDSSEQDSKPAGGLITNESRCLGGENH